MPLAASLCARELVSFLFIVLLPLLLFECVPADICGDFSSRNHWPQRWSRSHTSHFDVNDIFFFDFAKCIFGLRIGKFFAPLRYSFMVPLAGTPFSAHQPKCMCNMHCCRRCWYACLCEYWILFYAFTLNYWQLVCNLYRISFRFPFFSSFSSYFIRTVEYVSSSLPLHEYVCVFSLLHRIYRLHSEKDGENENSTWLVHASVYCVVLHGMAAFPNELKQQKSRSYHPMWSYVCVYSAKIPSEEYIPFVGNARALQQAAIS